VVTNRIARRVRLVRLCVSVGALTVLLAIQNTLVGLAPTKSTQAAAWVGAFILAAVLGVVAIRDLVGLVVQRFHGPQAVLWRNLSTWILYALLALWLASVRGVNLSGLLVGGAILGVVVATASQSSLGNFFSGLVLMVAQPYRVGAAIRLRSALVGGAEYEGTVIDQGALYTTLRGIDGETLKLPNTVVVTSALVMGGAPLRAAVDLELPARTKVDMLLDGLRARLGTEAVVTLEPQGFKAGEEDQLLCRLEVRSSTTIPSGAIAQAMVQALDAASRSHVAA
jgi:hypothetical protein